MVSRTTALNFAGSGVTVTGSNGAATITISGSSYGNSNVVTLLSAFGSNTVSTTGNVTGGYILGNGSQLTGLPAIYGNANVVANLAALGSNPVSTTGNVTGGNLLTGAQVVASGVIQTGTGFSTGGYLSVDGDTDLHKTTVTGNLSATGNVTGGNVLTGGIISATGNIFGGNAVFTGNLSVAGNVTYINSNVVTINDLAINLANNAANISLINGGGIELGPQGTPYVTFLYNTAANTFTSNVGLSAVANITGGNILTGGLISATGNVIGGNLNVTGNIVDTGALSIITGSNGNIALAPNGTGIVTASGNLSAVGNVTGGNILTAGLISGTGNVSGGNLTTANLTSTGSLSITGNTATVTTANYSIGYLNIPQVSLASNTTTALTDSGKHYYSTSASNLALTIANNTSVSWPVGTAISIINRGTGNITIAGGTGVSLYLAGNSTAGNRIVTTYGMATVMNVAANIWMINGTVV